MVFAAFPAELAALAAATEIAETITVAGRRYHVGRLGGVRVVLGLTGIGMVNAETAARGILEAVDAAGVIMTGVAGSPHRIGDVVVPTRWVERGRRRAFRTNRALLALAERAAPALAGTLGRCALVPPTAPDAVEVCMPHETRVELGGWGISGDPFGDVALGCIPGGGEVFGCELPLDPGDDALHAAMGWRADDPVTEDMETAAVARVATERRLPFLGVRAVSDGAGDPLGDRAFPAQFFDYYRLAADNAALVTQAVVATLGEVATDASARRTCRLLERGRWRRAAKRIGRER